MSSQEKSLSVPVAVVIGSLVISASILLSGGIISIKGVGGKADTTASATAPVAQPQVGSDTRKSSDQITQGLKSLAVKAGVQQLKFDSCLDSGEKATKVKADFDEGASLGVQGTPAFFVNGKPLFIGASPFTEFKKVIDDEIAGLTKAEDKKEVGVGDLPILGNESAKVTLIEFSDYECPFCSRFHTDAFKQIKSEYIDTGKVKFYYRDYPLAQIHPGAQKAAEATRCAADQGKFWEYHSLVFENQTAIF
ncbi:MAG: thioredoxin domain-containing protein [Candidatus Daviesbacteria bacterium]|nr:thioredoxin domain-containing protein [Candidatus Daviesbacteria bacterium]